MSASDIEEWFDKERLHIAADEGDIQTVNDLLKEGRDPNTFDEFGLTPLHNAASAGHVEIVELLVSSGANVNAHDENVIGNTPLGNIADNCSCHMATILLSLGADPTIKGWMQLSALDRAKQRTDSEGRQVYELLSRAAKHFRTP